MFLRTAYNYDRDAVSEETGLRCEGESLTKQSFAEDADINVMLRRFGVTGQMPLPVAAPGFVDVSEFPTDFREALEAVRAAERSFAQMDAEVRKRFGHDPVAFVDFLSDPANRPEAVKMGLVFEKKAEAAPVNGQPAAGAAGGS